MRRALATLALVAAATAACARSSETGGTGSPDGGARAAGADASASGFDDDARAPTSPLAIRPAAPTIHAAGAPVALRLEAVDDATQSVVAGVRWSIDRDRIAEIDPGSGVLTARGDVGGLVVVTATGYARVAKTTVTVDVAIEDAAPTVTSADRAKLRAGGALGNDPAFRWLYPYDATVFPRGLRAPLLQLSGAADAALVHVASAHFTYDAFVGGSDPIRVALPQARWRAITESAGGKDTVSISVTKLRGGVATGPVRETWIVAAANLRGSVYYSTYATPQAGDTGALMKVRPGAAADAEVFAPTCTACHSVSANGNVIVAGVGWADGNPRESGAFLIAPGNVPVPRYVEPLGRFAFGALSPNGDLVLTSALAPGGIRGLTGSTGSALYATASGQKLSAPGWDGARANAQMPSFSPDGRFVAFVDRDVSAGHTLSAMAFDAPTRTFSARAALLDDPSRLLAWPAFLPDARAVVFHAGSDFGTEHATADVELVDVATRGRARLPALNGFLDASGAFGPTYLPYGESAEGHLDYEPTVLPIAVGGYHWVVFTSRRAYGNVLTPATDPFAELSPRKKLWVAAIDQAGPPGADRSHPAFYLPGQDIGTSNMRGFWALDPCKADGASCESGDECCGGYCPSRASDAGSARACASVPRGCAEELEKCRVAADCCGAALGTDCVNGHCAAPAPR